MPAAGHCTQVGPEKGHCLCGTQRAKAPNQILDLIFWGIQASYHKPGTRVFCFMHFLECFMRCCGILVRGSTHKAMLAALHWGIQGIGSIPEPCPQPFSCCVCVCVSVCEVCVCVWYCRLSCVHVWRTEVDLRSCFTYIGGPEDADSAHWLCSKPPGPLLFLPIRWGYWSSQLMVL